MTDRAYWILLHSVWAVGAFCCDGGWQKVLCCLLAIGCAVAAALDLDMP